MSSASEPSETKPRDFRRRPRSKDAAAAEARPRSVLILDADPRNRAAVEGILTLESYRAESTGDPGEALRMIREDRPELVLVDIGMSVLEVVPRWERRRSDPEPVEGENPLEQGYAVLRALPLDPRAARYPTVYFREGGSDADRARAYRFGAVGYIAKPVEREALIEKIEATFLWLERLERPPDEPAPAAVHPDPQARSHGWSEAAGSLSAPAFDALPKGLRTALIVDADGESRRRVAGLLAPFGFTISEAKDGEEGLQLALARRPWLIVSEINMPRMDGFELCRRVRNHSLTRATPLIFLSAWDDYNERYLGMKLGANDYLAKGTPPREILIRIQLILKRYSEVGTRSRKGTGLEGTVELIGAPGILQMCHLGRFTGTCTVRDEHRSVSIRFRDGDITAAETEDLQGAEAVFALLAWSRGRFEFVPGDPGPGEPLQESFDYLLLEGCRRLDEVRREDTDPELRVNATS